MPIDDGCFEASVTQLGAHVSAGQRPAEQSTRAGGEDAGHVQPADPGRDVGDVAGPQLVQLAAAEASVREVIGRTSIWELLPDVSQRSHRCRCWHQEGSATAPRSLDVAQTAAAIVGRLARETDAALASD